MSTTVLAYLILFTTGQQYLNLSESHQTACVMGCSLRFWQFNAAKTKVKQHRDLEPEQPQHPVVRRYTADTS